MKVICVKWGEKFSSDYVNILYDMVCRNLKDFEFICHTDNSKDLYKNIKIAELPKNVEGWWNKLYLFKKYINEPVLYMDLDTIIFKQLSDYFKHEYKFIMLRDFYRSKYFASGIMFWNGDYSFLWDEYIENQIFYENKYAGTLGDGVFINDMMKDKEVKAWQDLFPNQFVSYKAHLRDSAYIPEEARICCFHGHPMPHEAKEEPFMQEIWKIGGGKIPDYLLTPNVSEKDMSKHIQVNIDRNLPIIPEKHDYPVNSKRVAVVGSAPSIKKYYQFLEINEYDEIWALNGVYPFLVEKGIIPTHFLCIDGKKENIRFLSNPQKETVHCLNANCHPSMFEKLKDNKIFITYFYNKKLKKILKEKNMHGKAIYGCTTVATFCLEALYAMGYRNIDIYGMDSSYKSDGTHHAVKQEWNDNKKTCRIKVNGIEYLTDYAMLDQFKKLKLYFNLLLREGGKVNIYCDGLIRELQDKE